MALNGTQDVIKFKMHTFSFHSIIHTPFYKASDMKTIRPFAVDEEDALGRHRTNSDLAGSLKQILIIQKGDIMKHIKISSCLLCPMFAIRKILKTLALSFGCGINNLEIALIREGEPLKADIPTWCPLDDCAEGCFESEIERLNIKFKEEPK